MVVIALALLTIFIAVVIMYPPASKRIGHWLLTRHDLQKMDSSQPDTTAQAQNELAFALLDTAVALTSTLELEIVVDHVLTNLERVVAHHESNVMILDGDEAIILGHKKDGVQSETEAQMRVSIVGAPYPTQMIATKQPVIVDNILDDTKLVRFGDKPTTIRSYMGVPIVLENQVIGFINLGNTTESYFNETHARYLQIFAFQTGIAIKNAQLFAQADSLAAQRERERIARELHDKVTQILFSANAIAEALPRILDRKPEKVHTYLQELSKFTQGAMANMRSLLVELHPQSLEKTELTILIKQLGDALARNHNIDITYSMMDKMLLSLQYQTALYRIVQEALNNVAAHANATQVDIKLQRNGALFELLIADNGSGFDTTIQLEEHMGLQIMRERAQEIAANLEICSQPNDGTQIILRGKIQ